MPNRPRYDVVLLNDNETPMEFVVRVLEVFFDMSFAEACKHMFRAHARYCPPFGVRFDPKATKFCV
jgi:ATP-dependent Clp protease adapter protein ClpS